MLCMKAVPLINDCEVAQDRDWAQRKAEVQMARCDPEVQGIRLWHKVAARWGQTFFFLLEQMLQEKLHSDSAEQMEDRPSSRAKHRSWSSPRVLWCEWFTA